MLRKIVISAALLASPAFASAQSYGATVSSSVTATRSIDQFGINAFTFDAAPCPAGQTQTGSGTVSLVATGSCSLSGTRSGTYQAWNPETFSFTGYSLPDFDLGTITGSASASISTAAMSSSLSAEMKGTIKGIGSTVVSSYAQLNIRAHVDDLASASGLTIYFPKGNEIANVTPPAMPGVQVYSQSGVLLTVNSIDASDGHVTGTPLGFERTGLSIDGTEWWGSGNLGNWPDDGLFIDKSYFNVNGDVNFVLEAFTTLVARSNWYADPVDVDLAATAYFGAPYYSVHSYRDEWPYDFDVTADHPVTFFVGEDESVAPEPSTFVLLLLPVIGLGVAGRRRRSAGAGWNSPRRFS